MGLPMTAPDEHRRPFTPSARVRTRVVEIELDFDETWEPWQTERVEMIADSTLHAAAHLIADNIGKELGLELVVVVRWAR